MLTTRTLLWEIWAPASEGNLYDCEVCEKSSWAPLRSLEPHHCPTVSAWVGGRVTARGVRHGTFLNIRLDLHLQL